MATQSELEKEIQYHFEQLREDYLEENGSIKYDLVPYGNIQVSRPCGYSDEDWEKATQHAKEELQNAIKNIINNN